MRAAAVLKAVDCSDVRMIERGEHLRLALEPRKTVGVGCERVRQNLESNLAIQLGITGAIDLAHAARADLGDDFVGAETCARAVTQGSDRIIGERLQNPLRFWLQIVRPSR